MVSFGKTQAYIQSRNTAWAQEADLFGVFHFVGEMTSETPAWIVKGVGMVFLHGVSLFYFTLIIWVPVGEVTPCYHFPE